MKIVLALLLLFSATTYGQNNNKDLYIAFDKAIGLENTNLSYGKLFTEKYRVTLDNHPYYKVNNFVKTFVNYQNEDFYDILLKYDILEDELIVSIPNAFKNQNIILEKLEVKAFKIDNKAFTHITNFGFLEVLYQTNRIELYKKNAKTKKKQLNKSYLYYKFIDNDSYLLQKDKVIFEVKNRKDFTRIFPSQKKMISNFYKTNKEIRKNNLDQFYQLLVTQLSKRINQ